MYSASDLKKGLKIEIDGMPWVITDFDFCKPGKGTALYRCRLKNLVNGAGMDRQVYEVPQEIDDAVSLLKLKGAGLQIDHLTDEQIAYLSGWQG